MRKLFFLQSDNIVHATGILQELLLVYSVISPCHISHMILGYSKLERCSRSPGERIMTAPYTCSTLDREDVHISIKLHSDIFIQTPLCQISCVASHILKINSVSSSDLYTTFEASFLYCED